MTEKKELQEEKKKAIKKTTKKKKKKTTRKRKSRAGRPTKFTPETVKKFEEAFSLDCTVSEACFYAGVSREAYYNFLERYPEYVDRFKALRNKPVLLARQELIKGIKGSPEMALKYLERKRKNEFSLKQEIQQETEYNGTVKFIFDE